MAWLPSVLGWPKYPRQVNAPISTLHQGSTVARWPGRMTVVASICSTMAGPGIIFPGRRRARSYTRGVHEAAGLFKKHPAHGAVPALGSGPLVSPGKMSTAQQATEQQNMLTHAA